MEKMKLLHALTESDDLVGATIDTMSHSSIVDESTELLEQLGMVYPSDGTDHDNAVWELSARIQEGEFERSRLAERIGQVVEVFLLIRLRLMSPQLHLTTLIRMMTTTMGEVSITTQLGMKVIMVMTVMTVVMTMKIGSPASMEVTLIRAINSLKKVASFKLASVLNLPVLVIKD